jgi:uncharacterized membrane protein YfcA
MSTYTNIKLTPWQYQDQVNNSSRVSFVVRVASTLSLIYNGYPHYLASVHLVPALALGGYLSRWRTHHHPEFPFSAFYDSNKIQ